ncbi:diguanylate cyclase domain-containing protein [Mixta intestinalis]|uniref:diguanylate cyclase n=1 Tax=Mixta intestinalis TaxID=1615494 RepID=A0A6P1Q178_9GAMM|nr:diguanylate cyclase [Mixta intestinalis]QHM71605.1 putative diguanylate cyclase YegE [Mixta intestinalis]
MTTDTFSPAYNDASIFRPALLLGLLCFFASLFCLALMALDNRISPLWYATAIMTAVVFRQRSTSLVILLTACLLGTLGANALFLGLRWPPLAWSVINLLQSIVGGWLLRRLLRADAPLDSLFSWCKMAVATGILTPLLGGLMALWWQHVSGGVPGLHFFGTWVLSEVIGMLTLGPICLLWQSRYFQRITQQALLEMLLTLAASLLLCCLALRFLPWPFTFVIVILFWVAVRLPRLEAFFIFFANVSLMSLMLAFHLIELHTANPYFMITAPWLPFLLVLIPSHIMTMVMYAFQEEKKHISASEAENQRLMERITLANEAGGIGVWEWDVTRNQMSWDKRMFAIYELDDSDRPTYGFWLNRLHPDDRTLAKEAVRRTLEENQPFILECRIVTRLGIRYIRSQANMLFNADGKATRMLGINQDVTELRQLNDALYQEKERMLITLDAIGEAVISIDEELRVNFMNPVAEQMSGWTQEQAEGKPISTILRITHGAHGVEIENILRCNLPNATTVTELDRDLILHNASGEQFAIHYSMTPLKTLEGKNIGSVLVIQDVSESREILKRLHYSASHDTLTRLPNRASFEHQLKRLLLSAAEKQQHALAFIDLDRFKAVNDSAGHAAGDALLRELAELMSHQLRGSDFLARLGGDEFGLLLPDCPLQDAQQAVQRIVNAINDYRFLWEGKLHRIGASAGLTTINVHNCQSSEVLAQADLACYNAKHNGRGQLSVYETRLQREQQVALSHADIVRLIAQPIRWQAWAVSAPHKPQSANFHLLQARILDAQDHEVDVEAFRASLTDAALRQQLDEALLNSFFNQCAAGVARKALNVVLPLAAESLLDPQQLDRLLDRLDNSPLHGDLLIVSLETSMLLNHAHHLFPVLLRLRQQGCRIMSRHFGRNLDAFDRLPQDAIDFLQMAPDLIANVHCNLMDEMLVSIIHGQAQRLRIATVAGPVDLPVALSTLGSIGVDAVWGGGG